MKNLNFILIALLAIAISFASGCKEDETQDPVTGEALFSYEADGQTVTFTNLSTVTGTVTYGWEFGDGETSTEKDPVHTYASKGEYTVKLTVTDANGGAHPVSTKILVDKATRIDLNDDSFDDWDAVTEEGLVVPVGDNSGIVMKAKFDYDAKYIYCYIKMEAQLADENIHSAMFDTDNSAADGMNVWMWPLMGADFLIEGQMLVSEIWYSGFNYTGPGGDVWEWEEKELPSESLVVGTVKEDGATVTYEMAYDRTKIPGFNNDMVKIGIYISSSEWSEIGFIPDQTPEDGDPVDAWLIDMR